MVSCSPTLRLPFPNTATPLSGHAVVTTGVDDLSASFASVEDACALPAGLWLARAPSALPPVGSVATSSGEARGAWVGASLAVARPAVSPSFPPPVRAVAASGGDAHGDEAGAFFALGRPPVPPSFPLSIRAATEGGDKARGDEAGAWPVLTRPSL